MKNAAQGDEPRGVTETHVVTDAPSRAFLESIPDCSTGCAGHDRASDVHDMVAGLLAQGSSNLLHCGEDILAGEHPVLVTRGRHDNESDVAIENGVLVTHSGRQAALAAIDEGLQLR